MSKLAWKEMKVLFTLATFFLFFSIVNCGWYSETFIPPAGKAHISRERFIKPTIGRVGCSYMTSLRYLCNIWIFYFLTGRPCLFVQKLWADQWWYGWIRSRRASLPWLHIERKTWLWFGNVWRKLLLCYKEYTMESELFIAKDACS